MEYTYIPTGIKWELVRFGVDCDQKGKLSGMLEEDRWLFILVDRLFLVSPHIEMEEVYGCQVLAKFVGFLDECHHLELAYQFILSSRHSPGVKLR